MSSDDDDMPEEPMTETQAIMTQAHELYVEACRAGFTEEQAMAIIIGIIRRSNL